MDTVLTIFRSLGVDQTVFIQFGIFMVLFLALKSIFFNRLQSVLELREGKTTKLESEANKKLNEAQELEKKYKTLIDKAYSEAQEQFNRQKNEAIREQTMTFKEVESEVNSKLESERKDFEKQLEKKKSEVMMNADGLAKSLVEKLTQ